MKIVELVGKDIMKAYDGNYLSNDFGYSCANFNVKQPDTNLDNFYRNWRGFESLKTNENFGDHDNDEATFDFYTRNPKNVSCFVCYDDDNKICGRRMFFKGKSAINDNEFDYPISMGKQSYYLYGYYGRHDGGFAIKKITGHVLNKYSSQIIFTDREVFNKRRIDYEIPRFWIMIVENANFSKYPPIDFLKISTELKALSNFKPKSYILDILKRDFHLNKLEFHNAYRYNPIRKNIRYDYKTWDQHKGLITNMEDYTKEIQD